VEYKRGLRRQVGGEVIENVVEEKLDPEVGVGSVGDKGMEVHEGIQGPVLGSSPAESEVVR